MKILKAVFVVFLMTSPLMAVNAYASEVCRLMESDSDGDGWGWEAGASCRVTPETGVTPEINHPRTGNAVTLERIFWVWNDFNGKTISECQGYIVDPGQSRDICSTCIAPTASLFHGTDGNGVYTRREDSTRALAKALNNDLYISADSIDAVNDISEPADGDGGFSDGGFSDGGSSGGGSSGGDGSSANTDTDEDTNNGSGDGTRTSGDDGANTNGEDAIDASGGDRPDTGSDEGVNADTEAGAGTSSDEGAGTDGGDGSDAGSDEGSNASGSEGSHGDSGEGDSGEGADSDGGRNADGDDADGVDTGGNGTEMNDGGDTGGDTDANAGDDVGTDGGADGGAGNDGSEGSDADGGSGAGQIALQATFEWTVDNLGIYAGGLAIDFYGERTETGVRFWEESAPGQIGFYTLCEVIPSSMGKLTGIPGGSSALQDASACIDIDGDGWGWDGSASCIP